MSILKAIDMVLKRRPELRFVFDFHKFNSLVITLDFSLGCEESLYAAIGTV
jgi:hypothetical protein